MKEIITNTESGDIMVTRFTLTQSGVNVNRFLKVNNTVPDVISDEEYDAMLKTDYPYESSTVVSDSTGWLDVNINVFNRIALYRPKMEILNPFSESSKILIMAGDNIVKTFNIGGLTGTVEFDFLENDALIGNEEDPEDTTVYFKNSGFMATIINDWASPIILNPYSPSNPLVITINLVGNVDPSASGVFKVSIRTVDS